jgi:prevent-host-death family protein
MREIQASNAKAHLFRLLNDVERGETIVITRHRRPIARIIPEARRRQEQIDRAVEQIKALGKEIAREHGPISIEEIVSLVYESHKY